MRWTRARNLTSWLFVTGIGLLMGLAIMSFFLGLKILETNRDVIERNQTGMAMEKLLAAFVETQNSVRGYLLTENPEYLAPYYAGMAQLKTHQARILQSHTFSREELSNLKSLIAEHQDILTTNLQLRRTLGREATIEEINKGAGRTNLERIQTLINEQTKGLEKTISLVEVELTTLTVSFVVFVITALTGAAGVSLAQFVLFRREISLQMKMEASLQAQSKNIELISRFSDSMQAAISRDESYRIIKSYGHAILEGAYCVLYVYNNSRDQLLNVTSWGANDETPVLDHFAPDECWALRRGRAYAGDAIQGQINCLHHLADPPYSYTCLPITASGQIIGLFYLHRFKLDHDSLNGLLEKAAAFVEQLSLAMVNLELNERLQHMAIHDSLTGLYNRRVLDEILIREFARADRNKYPLSFLMMDIDHFKKLNDTHGHLFGDQVLGKVAGILSAMARQTDTVCRYGGEEFLIVFSDCNLEQAAAKAEKIRLAVKNMMIGDDSYQALPISISIGVASYPESALNKKDIIRLADEAMYEAKRKGRDQVCIYEDISGQPQGIGSLISIPSEGVKKVLG